MTKPTLDLRTDMTRAVVGGFDSGEFAAAGLRLTMAPSGYTGYEARSPLKDIMAKASTPVILIDETTSAPAAVQPPKHLNPAQAGVWSSLN